MHARTLLFAISLLACSSSSSTEGSTTDGGGDGPGSDTVGADGGGGWAVNAAACPDTGGVCDAWLDTTVDAHGCPALVLNGSKCCGCPPLKDSGIDGDAAEETSSDASGD